MGQRVAVVGAGMTRFVRRAQETGKELAWQAAKAALDSAEMTLDDVDCVAMGSAPDAFDGVHMKGEYLADGAGAWGKPYFRTYVGGGTGVFVTIHGWYQVASGMFDTSVAVVLAAEHVAKRIPDKPVWIDGVGWHLDTAYWTNRDLYYPRYVEYAARMAYDMAGIREPRKEINIAEAYDPFDYKELHHLEGLLLFDKGKAPEAMKDGVLNRDGDLPSTPSGGLLGVGNPIAAAGLMKIAELYWQLSGQAGDRQVPGDPRRGVAQAWGDLMQVGTVVVMGR